MRKTKTKDQYAEEMAMGMDEGALAIIEQWLDNCQTVFENEFMKQAVDALTFEAFEKVQAYDGATLRAIAQMENLLADIRRRKG